MSQSDRYIPEHDYKKTNYKPLGRPFTKDMCGSCKSYYKGLFNAGITKKEFPIECSGHILDQVKQLNREDFDSDEDFDLAKIFSDPVAWAKFEFGWDHRWYQEFVSSCLPASEMVFMDDGTLKSIKDIKIGDKVVTYDNKGCRTFSNKVTKFFDNGVKPVYKISLENGDTLKCTRDHKILAHTKSGRTNSLFDCKSLQVDYISLDDGLKIGDRVYSINSFDKFGNVNNTDLAKWLGYIASDSYVKKCKLVQFVNTNKKYVDEFIELTNKLFPNDPLQVDFRASSFDSETGIERKDSWLCSIYKKDSKALRFLESIGVEGPETRELKSFEFAFKFSKESLGAFLNRLYSGDGCISTSINKERGIYTSRLSLHGGNEEPLKLMRLLLKKVGVNSSHINFKKDSNSVGLFISAGLNIIRFLDFTGLIFGKEENSLLAYNTSLGKRANRRRFSRASRTKITSIEYAGVERVYDIEVSSRHNFIAGGTVVHNCTARKKVLRGGRRSGKSRVEIVLILHEMVTLPNRKILLLAPSEKLIGEFFDVISEFIKMSSTLKDSIERSTKNPHLLQLKNGSKLLGISISPKDPDAGDKARGFDANLFIIDESEMFKEKDMEAIMALLVSSPDTRVMISSTPKGWRKHFYRICFPEGTRILTTTGEKSIERIDKGETILSCTGHTDYVKDIMVRDYSGDLYSIELKRTSEKIECTPEHPIFVKRGCRKPEFIEAKELKRGDYVGITIPRYNSSETLVYPDIPEFPGKHKDLKYNYNTNSFIDQGYFGLIDSRHELTYSQTLDIVDYINSNIDAKKSFYTFMGYYLAEGNIMYTNQNGERYFSGAELTFKLDEDLVELSKKAIETFLPGKTVSIIRNVENNSTKVRVFCKELAIICLFFGKEYSHSKEIHYTLLNNTFTKYLIDAYLAGDGWEVSYKKGISRSVTTVSKRLAIQVWHYFLISGISVSFYHDKTDNRRDRYIVRTSISKNSKNMIWYRSMPFVKIEDIRIAKFSGKVYNLETKLTNTYSANGFAVHNCTNKNLAYKEFWWISGEKPDWTTEMEAQLKEEYTEAGYTSEFNADFGELEEGTFKKKYIDPSLRNYDCTFNGPERGRTYVLGVDWNKSAGNHMVICEIEGGMITMRKKIITPESEFMHTKAVEDITLLHRMWNFKYIFVDAGYGHTNVELLKKWGLENPASGMLKALHAVYMNEDIEVKDPINGEAVRRRAKPYIVEQTVKLLEDGCLILPSSEDYGHVGEGLSDIGLVEQMRNFRIERYSVYNLPTYSQGQDHTLTAYMLCCAMWVNKEGPLKDPRYSNKVWNIPTATTQEIPLTPTEKEMLKTMEKNKFIRSSGHIDPRNKKYHKKKENISRSNLGPPGRGRSFNWTNRNTF